MQPDFDKIIMTSGKTAQEYINTRRKDIQPLAKQAILQCLEKGWSLNVIHVGSTIRELYRERENII